jgi:hypothetical protein
MINRTISVACVGKSEITCPLECFSKLLFWVAPGDEGAAEREKGFVDVRAAFVT